MVMKEFNLAAVIAIIVIGFMTCFFIYERTKPSQPVTVPPGHEIYIDHGFHMTLPDCNGSWTLRSEDVPVMEANGRSVGLVLWCLDIGK
jgi:hypothetical protein